MIDNMKKSSAESQHRYQGRFKADSQQSDPKPHSYDPDVLHTVISEEPLQIVLRQRKQDTSTPDVRPIPAEATPHTPTAGRET